MKKILFLVGVTFVFIFYSCDKNDNIEDFSGDSGTYTDERDNIRYSWVKVGSQIWFAENLKYATDSGSWIYKNELQNLSIYGRLYNWETACNVCPDGWHLPTDNEWKELEMYIGMSKEGANDYGWRETDEGDKLKSKNGWQNDKN